MAQQLPNVKLFKLYLLFSVFKFDFIKENEMEGPCTNTKNTTALEYLQENHHR